RNQRVIAKENKVTARRVHRHAASLDDGPAFARVPHERVDPHPIFSRWWMGMLVYSRAARDSGEENGFAGARDSRPRVKHFTLAGVQPRQLTRWATRRRHVPDFPRAYEDNPVVRSPEAAAGAVIDICRNRRHKPVRHGDLFEDSFGIDEAYRAS